MQPPDPKSSNSDPQPPQVPQSPYSAPQSPFNAPQQSPYGGGQQPPYGSIAGAEKKIPAGICGILLGALGVHKFVLGYTNEGLIMLIISLVGGMLTCGMVSGVVHIIGIIEGIIYLTKTDQQFVQEYVQNKKPWF